MTEYLPGMESERRDVSLSQWPTPPKLAKRIVEWALDPLEAYATVLEPSAGHGNLAAAIRDYPRKVAIGSPVCVEIDQTACEHLEDKGFDAYVGDFLAIGWDLEFDIAIMNPPFEGGQTEAHILKALRFCKRVVCHCPLTTLAGQERRVGLWSLAYLKRLVIHSARPKYGAEGGKTDMCTIEVVHRCEQLPADGTVAASGVAVEWWA